MAVKIFNCVVLLPSMCTVVLSGAAREGVLEFVGYKELFHVCVMTVPEENIYRYIKFVSVHDEI